ncbi:MAG: hypothetical protein K2F91_08130, partial [Muribaculaceae bacterium]|nr:hypothetical protein [Muribaculaceae bacterium]
MTKNLLKGITAVAAMMLGSFAADAAMPENIYLVGPSSPGLWNLDYAPEMVNEGDGVFSYRGNLYKGELQFIDAKNWDTAIRYVPEVSGWHIVDASDATIIGEINSDRKWYVPEFGTWEVKASFVDEGNSVMFTAKRVGDLSPLMVPLGAAPGQWDSAFPNPGSYIYPEEGTTDVFVWEGRLPYNERNQLKFISYPTNWWEAEFYVPASVDEGQIFKTVTLGEKYPVKKALNANGDALDLFWSLAMEDCRPYMTYKATLNKSDMTIVFTEGEQTHVPEHLYITGSASPSLWNHDMVEMVSEGNGVYSYRGNLYMGEMRFLNMQDFGAAISYVPLNGGTHITDTSSAILQIEGEPGRNWWVPEYGEWNVIVTITEGGRKVRV